MNHSNIRWLCLPFLALLLASVGAFAGQHTMQFHEDGVRVRDLHGTTPVRVCDSGSQWIRVGFESLQLHGDDLAGPKIYSRFCSRPNNWYDSAPVESAQAALAGAFSME